MRGWRPRNLGIGLEGGEGSGEGQERPYFAEVAPGLCKPPFPGSGVYLAEVHAGDCPHHFISFYPHGSLKPNPLGIWALIGPTQTTRRVFFFFSEKKEIF